MQTLLDALHHVETVYHKGYRFLGNDLTETYYSFNALVREAKSRGRHLQAMGLRKGDRLAMVIPESEDFVLTFLGAVSVGVVPVPMYPPLALGKLDGYIDTAARILEVSKARMLVTTKKASPILWSLTGRVRTLEDLFTVDRFATELKGKGDAVEIAPEDPCFLQFTSGSTSDPKGVVVTHGSLIANAHAIMFEGLESHEDRDVGLSWLPLYHDMGLIGFVLSPLVARVPVVFVPTLTFVKRPTVWMEAVSKYKATITFAPNFAFALAAKHAGRQVGKEGFDLSSLRVVGCGAEPINPQTLRGFIDAFGPAKLNPHSIMPCYGMAEATLAISFDTLKSDFSTTTIDRERYENERVAAPFSGEKPENRFEVVSCGRTFKNHEVGIMGDEGKLLGDGQVGEIVFRGPSVTAGYFENDEASRAAFKSGWLHTGDLGFMVNGEVFISGRKKDLIILNGRNYYPQALEWAMENIAGLRKGNVVAFSVPGANSEELVMVAETRSNGEGDQSTIVEAMREALKNEFGVVAKDIALVPAGSLPKTSSGKLQRQKTRQEYMNGTLGVGNRTLGSNSAKTVLARHITKSVFAQLRHKVRKMQRGLPVALGGEAKRDPAPRA